MSKKILDNIFRMTRPELIGLAKNRFLPTNIQLAIARHHYARAHSYLAENAGLDKTVRDYLWSDECNRGYSLKTTLLMHGHYASEPEKYWEFYDRYQNSWYRSYWRFSSAFFGCGWWHPTGQSHTPADLLNRIYDDKYCPKRASREKSYNQRYELERLAKHKNIDLSLAIKLSQSGIDSVQKLGFDKIVELS